MNRLALALGAAALTACATVATVLDPPLAQLARWRDAPAQRIAEEPVVAPCPAGHAACPRLHARRAAACMELAMSARAPLAACPGLAQRMHLECAVAAYAGADAGPVHAANHAQAALCLAELSGAQARLALGRRALALSPEAPPAQRAELAARARAIFAPQPPDASP